MAVEEAAQSAGFVREGALFQSKPEPAAKDWSGNKLAIWLNVERLSEP